MIKLVNVSKYYSSNNTVALGLRKVNLELHLNEFVAVVGESGSGKTTLLNVISGTDSYEEGEMYINGEETSYFSVTDLENYRKKYIAFVFQNYNLIESYTVLQNVEAPLILSGYPKNQIRARAMELIRRVGLEKHIHHKATKLSGGQKQRVVIARALAKDCPVIAADEPTGNLDSVSAKQILELLHEISKEKLVILVTHDFEQVKDYAARKIRIYDGEIVEDHDLTEADKKNIPTIPDTDVKTDKLDYARFSLKNLLAVPKKTFLMMFVFFFSTFFLAYVYGQYVIVTDEGDAYGYSYNEYFNNTSPNRILIHKTDRTPFTTAELAAFASDDRFKTVIPFDFLLDENLSGIYLPEDPSSVDGGYYFPYSVLPLSAIDESDLDQGVMASASDEGVLALASYYASTYDGYLNGTIGGISITGVILDSGDVNLSDDNYLFVPDDVFQEMGMIRYFNNYVLNSSFDGVNQNDEATVFTDWFSDLSKDNVLVVDETIADGVLAFHPYDVPWDCDGLTTTCTLEGDLTYSDIYGERTIDNLTFDFTHDEFASTQIHLNSNTLNTLFGTDIYQVTLIATTKLGVEKVVSNLRNEETTDGDLMYKVLHPYSDISVSLDSLTFLFQTILFLVYLVLT
ncbi:MAG: ABC transporter ATP-binding protein, partial [Candidatus Izemoplasmatales bacterium]